MRKFNKSKGSERLLIASGRPLAHAIVLARVKPYSHEFRAWGGIHDNPYQQAVVLRRLVAPDAKLSDLAQDVDRSISGSPPIPETPNTAGTGTPIEANAGFPAMAGFPTPTRAPPGRGTAVPQSPVGEMGSQQPTNTNIVLPRPAQMQLNFAALGPEAVARAEHTIVRFSSSTGQIMRMRSLLHCCNPQALFVNAMAAGVISRHDPLLIADCRVTLTDKSVRRCVIVDEQDFVDMSMVVLNENAWHGDNECCFIDVAKFHSL
jgi:hypothetical protein